MSEKLAKLKKKGGGSDALTTIRHTEMGVAHTSGTTSMVIETYREPDAFIGLFGRYGGGQMFPMLKDGTTYDANHPSGFQSGMSYNEITHLLTISNPNVTQSYSSGFVIYDTSIKNLEFQSVTSTTYITNPLIINNIMHEPRIVFISIGVGSGYVEYCYIEKIDEGLFYSYDNRNSPPESYTKTSFSYDESTHQLVITGINVSVTRVMSSVSVFY